MSQAAQTSPVVIVGGLGSGKGVAIKTMLARFHGSAPITVIVRGLPPASWVPSARVLGLGAAPSKGVLNPLSISGAQAVPATNSSCPHEFSQATGRRRPKQCTSEGRN